MSEYEINWLVILNDVLEGFSHGMGFCLALLLCYLMVSRASKKPKGDAGA